MKYAYAYILDSMADWELGYIMAELNSGQYFKDRGSRIPVKLVGASKRSIKTKGGMTIVPDLLVENITHDTSAILLLPGADTWKDRMHLPIIEKAKQLLNKGCHVAAICGDHSACRFRSIG